MHPYEVVRTHMPLTQSSIYDYQPYVCRKNKANGSNVRLSVRLFSLYVL